MIKNFPKSARDIAAGLRLMVQLGIRPTGAELLRLADAIDPPMGEVVRLRPALAVVDGGRDG